MIRGPVLPQMRESLWALVANRLGSIERGLVLAFEGIDCSSGQLGLVDGMARDASGAPVLVLLAVEGDALLSARALSAADFLRRVGDSLTAAVPEANFCPGAAGRVLVIGTESAKGLLEQVACLPLPSFLVCRLEPFRIAGAERFAVTWVAAAASGLPACEPPEFVVAPACQAAWSAFARLCARIDPGVRIDGDRYWRRITWNGHVLGELWSMGGRLFGASAGEARASLSDDADLSALADRLLRQYMRHAGLEHAAAPAGAGTPTSAHPGQAAARHPAYARGAEAQGNESLRSVLAATRLSPEEYSALGSALSADQHTDGAATAEDVARIVASQESPWPPPRATD